MPWNLPPQVRRFLPPLVLGLAALSSLVWAVELWMLVPDLPQLGASFAGAAALQAVGAWGLYHQRFWARGYGVGALLSSGLGAGIWLTSSGIAISATLLAVIILLMDDAPGRYERRTAFLEQRKLDRAGATRLFYVGLGLGVALPALLGSTLSLRLVLLAPIPTLLAASLGSLALLGLTRLASWAYFALVGAIVASIVAVVLSALDGYAAAAGWGGVASAALVGAALPLTGPVIRALRGPRPR